MWHRQLFGGGKLCGAELQGMWHRQLFGKGVCVWICVAQNSKVCGTGSCLDGGGCVCELCGAELQGMWHRQLFGKGLCV